MASSPEHILIVGGGIFGASTAYHLTHPASLSSTQATKDNIPRVTLLDRSPLGAGIGASEDINKIIRADYSQKLYMELGYEAIDAWKSFSELGGILEGLYHQTGWMVLDTEEGDHYKLVRKLYSERGMDPTQTLSLEDAKHSYGGILGDADMAGFHSAYINPEAGWADAGTAVKRMIEESIKAGLDFRVGDAEGIVLDSRSGVKGVRLANGEIIYADKILLATGAWTSSLIHGSEEDLELEDNERVERQLTAAGTCVAHYHLTKEEIEFYSRMPVILNGEKGEVIPPTDDGILKFTFANSVTNMVSSGSRSHISVPPFQDQSIVPQLLKDEILGAVQTLMPNFLKDGRKVDSWRLCWDSITPTQNQLICRHPNTHMRNLYFAVGGSFHSYKFLPIIGKYVANVIRDISNGEEKDQAWAWKTPESQSRLKSAHAKVVPRRDLKDV